METTPTNFTRVQPDNHIHGLSSQELKRGAWTEAGVLRIMPFMPPTGNIFRAKDR